MWAYNSIFYQIYPIGFCGAPVHNDGVCVPRIRKLMDWSEYLQTLDLSPELTQCLLDIESSSQQLDNYFNQFIQYSKTFYKDNINKEHRI